MKGLDKHVNELNSDKNERHGRNGSTCLHLTQDEDIF